MWGLSFMSSLFGNVFFFFQEVNTVFSKLDRFISRMKSQAFALTMTELKKWESDKKWEIKIL